jgi:hypothetical protein
VVPIPRAAVLPPEIERELRPIAEKLRLDMPAAIRALTEIVTRASTQPEVAL